MFPRPESLIEFAVKTFKRTPMYKNHAILTGTSGLKSAAEIQITLVPRRTMS